ncbi:hypothetical protein I552_8801 [Mycobacterium xenopi 3993]|nr:hypothetical protein I552_8801 [Mycobacterium xenopi 3993]
MELAGGILHAVGVDVQPGLLAQRIDQRLANPPDPGGSLVPRAKITSTSGQSTAAAEGIMRGTGRTA